MDLKIIAIIFFLLIEVLVIIRNVKNKSYSWFLWFCDFAPILLVIFTLTNQIQLTKALINIGLTGQALAFVTWIPKRIFLLFKKETNRFKKYKIIVEALLHLTLPLALILTFNVTPERISIIYSIIILSLMFFLVLLFAPKKENINAVYYLELNHVEERDKGIKKFKLPFHKELWIVYSSILVIINYVIQNLLHKIFI